MRFAPSHEVQWIAPYAYEGHPTMTFTFTDAATIHREFFGVIFYCSVVVVLFLVLWTLEERSSNAKTTVGSLLALLMACVGVATAFGVSAKYGDFLSMEIRDTSFRLQYAGPYRAETVKFAEIETVVWGTQAKYTHRARSCYVRILRKSGVSLRSADTPEPVEFCKQLREQMLTRCCASAPATGQAKRRG